MAVEDIRAGVGVDIGIGQEELVAPIRFQGYFLLEEVIVETWGAGLVAVSIGK